MAGPQFEIELASQAPGRIALSGHLGLGASARLRAELGRHLASPSGPLTIDLSGVDALDGSAAAVLAELRDECRGRGGGLAFEGARPAVASVLALFTAREPRASLRPERARTGLLTQVGRATVSLMADTRQGLAFIGAFVLGLLAGLRRPATVDWPAVPRLMERHGSDGLPIVLLIGFLIGVITAFQAAVQLAKLGAESFIADLVALSLTRELAPLMTAIVVAGRSGAAIAAELGTMRVSEEIDALRALGIDPQRHLVLPRVLALTAVLPLLTLLSDAIGVAGGALIAFAQLDLGFVGFFNATRDSLDLADVFGGVAKSLVFGFLIAFIGCERGLATRGGAEGVGRSTTTAVVTILFQLIVVDALFTVLYKLLGI